MKWRSINSTAVVLLAAGMLLSLTQAKVFAQSVQTYTSLADWQAAVSGSPQYTITFQDINLPTYFQTSAAGFGLFSLQQIGQDPVFGYLENFIDVPPLQFTDNSGVATAALFTKYSVSTVNMSFGVPVYAWGANFYGAQTDELENIQLFDTNGNVINTVPVTVGTGFFGFVVSPAEGLSQITFSSQLPNPDPKIGQGFGLENVTAALISALTPAQSGSVSTSASGLVYSRVTQTFNGTITLKNVSKHSIPGPFQLVFPSLPSGVTLIQSAGVYNGNPFMNVNLANLSAGQSVTLAVRFSNSSNTKIVLSPIVYSGGL